MEVRTLQAWREKRGYSRPDLGKKCSVTERTIYSIEKSGNLPSKRIAFALAGGLGVKVGQIQEFAAYAEQQEEAPIDKVIDDPFWRSLTTDELAYAKREIEAQRRREAWQREHKPSRSTYLPPVSGKPKWVSFGPDIPRKAPIDYDSLPDYETEMLYQSLLSVTKDGTFDPFDSSDSNVKAAREKLSSTQWDTIVAAYQQRIASRN